MQLASGVDPVPVLEWVTLVGVDPDGMAHLMQLLLSVWVDLYLTSQHMFACLVDLPAEGLPSVAETPHKAFAAWRSICAVPSVDHVTQLGGIYPPDWKTNPCERAKKTAGKDYFDLACRGLTFAPPDCAVWVVEQEADGPLNVFKASKGLSLLLTGREPTPNEALNWLKFAYTADQAGAYVAPASRVLAQSVVVEGEELFLTFMAYLRILYPEV